jgi:hypothetical protein
MARYLGIFGLGACAQGEDFFADVDDPFVTATLPTSDSTASDNEDVDSDDSTGASTTATLSGNETTGQSTQSTSSSDDSGVSCGNGTVEGGESCDLGDLSGKTCASFGFVGGALACTTSCTFDTAKCHFCGNNTINPGENCDGINLGTNATCADLGLGLPTEALSCRDNCTYDLSECGSCGDGVVAPPEECEPGDASSPANLNGQSCATLGFDGGVLSCSQGCGFDTSGCFDCGDGIKHPLEACDGRDFGDATCSSMNGSDGKPFESGQLSCTSTCQIDAGSCWTCGDGAISGDEVCDGGNLANESCTSLSHSAGTLACAPDCLTFNESGCTDCGDAIREGEEQCDKTDLNGKTCKDLVGLGGGTLACTSSCVFDTSNCDLNSCGDGIINGSDQCDCVNNASCTSAELAGKTCMDQGFDGGKLSCFSPSNCSYDTSACYRCGDGEVNPGESCDGLNLGGKTCADVGNFDGGTLGCTMGCGFDTSACTRSTRIEICRNAPSVWDFSQTQSILISETRSEAHVIKNIEVGLWITHDWVGEIAVSIIGPAGESRLLYTPGVATTGGLGCMNDDVAATFSDKATDIADTMCMANKPTIRGTVKPYEPLAMHVGKSMKGTWTIRARQLFEAAGSGTTGYLTRYCIWYDY